MSLKCSDCNKKIEETFLGKIIGTYVNGKPVCRDCQLKTNSKPKSVIKEPLKKKKA